MVFGKLLNALKKTRDVLTTGLSRLFQGRKLDEAFLEELEEVLYNSDLGPLGTRIVEELKESYKKREVRSVEEVPAFLRVRLLDMMQACEGELTRAASGPTVILVVGVNGAGKTTSIAKLANHLKKQGHSVLLGAGDTFRAAAVEQLTMWAERLEHPDHQAGHRRRPGRGRVRRRGGRGDGTRRRLPRCSTPPVDFTPRRTS